VGKIGEKAVCKSVFLTIWHCNCRINKNALLQTNFFFGDFAQWATLLTYLLVVG